MPTCPRCGAEFELSVARVAACAKCDAERLERTRKTCAPRRRDDTVSELNGGAEERALRAFQAGDSATSGSEPKDSVSDQMRRAEVFSAAVSRYREVVEELASAKTAEAEAFNRMLDRCLESLRACEVILQAGYELKQARLEFDAAHLAAMPDDTVDHPTEAAAQERYERAADAYGIALRRSTAVCNYLGATLADAGRARA